MATYFNDKTGKWEDDSGREIDPTSGRTATISPDVAEAGANAAAARKDALAARNVQSFVNAAGGAIEAPKPAPAAAPAVGSVITKPDGTTIMAPPPQSFKESDYSKTTKQSQATAGEVVAQGALQNALEAKKDAIKDQAVVDREKAGVTAEHEQGELARQQRVEQARKDAIAWGEQEYARRRQDLDAHLAKVENFQFRDYWSNKSTGDKVMAGIGVALGALGSALTGQENRALGIIRDAVKEDREHQMQELQKLERIGERKREALGIAKEEFEMRKNNLEYAEVAGLQVAKQALTAKLAKAGLNESQIKANADMVKLDEEIARAKITFEEKNRKDITTQVQSRQRQVEGGTGKPGEGPSLTERQAFNAANETAGNMARLRELVAKNPAAWKEYQEAYNEQRRAAEADKSLLGPAYRLGKAGDIAALGIDQRLKSDDSREISRLLSSAITAQARVMDPVGAINEGSIKAAQDALSLGSQPASGIVRMASSFEDQARRAAAAAARPGMVQQPAAAAAPAAPTMTNTAPAAAGAQGAQETKRVRNRKTGQEMTLYKHSDGQWYDSP